MKKIEVPAYIKGLIFDCDGTLVDSMPLHMKAWEHVIRHGGGAWDYDFFFSNKGMPEALILSLYNKQYSLALDSVKTLEAKHAFFKAHADELKPIQIVVDVALSHRGTLPMAVVSGGVSRIVRLELKALNILELFPVILTADDNMKPKPAPDLFLEAARRMNVAPELCQVFEDGDHGLDAARAAAMLPTDVREFIDGQ